MISYIALLSIIMIVRSGSMKYIYNKKREALYKRREELKDLIKSIK